MHLYDVGELLLRRLGDVDVFKQLFRVFFHFLFGVFSECPLEFETFGVAVGERLIANARCCESRDDSPAAAPFLDKCADAELAEAVVERPDMRREAERYPAVFKLLVKGGEPVGGGDVDVADSS